MNGTNRNLLKQADMELKSIKFWIRKNKLHSNVQYLNHYAIIKTSGTIEIVFKKIIFEYLSKGTNQETVCYLDKKIIQSSDNPTSSKICEILKSLNTDWCELFKLNTKGLIEKSNLDSLIRERNKVAHGRSSVLSINDIELYYKSGIKIIRILDRIVR